MPAVVKVPLTHGAFAEVDEADLPLISGHRWQAKHNGRKTYAWANGKVGDKRVSLYMHRLIIGAPAGEAVDHINGDGLDNRRENLRVVSRSQNRRNVLKGKGSSRFVGVTWAKNEQRWRAQIASKDGIKHLGAFREENEAAVAYDLAAIARDPEMAGTNFPKRLYFDLARYKRALERIEGLCEHDTDDLLEDCACSTRMTLWAREALAPPDPEKRRQGEEG